MFCDVSLGESKQERFHGKSPCECLIYFECPGLNLPIAASARHSRTLEVSTRTLAARDEQTAGHREQGENSDWSDLPGSLWL